MSSDSVSASRSECLRLGRGHWTAALRGVALAAICVAVFAMPCEARAEAFLSQQEALALAFPGNERIEVRNFVLTSEQKGAIEQRAKAALASQLASLYVGWEAEKIVGYAWIDLHTVRTQPEALMIVLDPRGTVRSVRALAFYEPPEYLPPQRFRDGFNGASDPERLRLEADVHAVAGSTLTSRATAEAVRRALAIYAVLVAPTPQTPEK